jgi:hypothetical protein
VSPPLAVSKVDYPIYTEQEYRALMLAEFGPVLPFLNHAMKLTDDVDIQAPPLPEEESQAMITDKNEMQAFPTIIPPCRDIKDGRKMRKKQPPPPPPPCTDEAIHEPSPPIPPCRDNKEGPKKRKKQQPPPPCTDNAIDKPSPRPSKRAKKKKRPSPCATNKIMATRLLGRYHSAPEPSKAALWCHCKELPQDSKCALHQKVPFGRWIKEKKQRPPMPNDGVMVPKTSRDSKLTVAKYIRWRSRAWMPSRFYVEHAQLEMAH